MLDATSIIDYSYSDFRDGVDAIAQQITESGFRPDYIVGIVRGGSVPAVYLSHKLKVPVVMLSWNTRDAGVAGNESITWIPEDLHAGKKVILIDDIIDGGDTIREVLDDWYQSSAGLGKLPLQNIRLAAMYYNTAQDVNVDFYHHTIDRNIDQRWIHFPWEG